MRFCSESAIPENVVNQMNDALVHEKHFFVKRPLVDSLNISNTEHNQAQAKHRVQSIWLTLRLLH